MVLSRWQVLLDVFDAPLLPSAMQAARQFNTNSARSMTVHDTALYCIMVVTTTTIKIGYFGPANMRRAHPRRFIAFGLRCTFSSPPAPLAAFYHNPAVLSPYQFGAFYLATEASNVLFVVPQVSQCHPCPLNPVVPTPLPPPPPPPRSSGNRLGVWFF